MIASNVIVAGSVHGRISMHVLAATKKELRTA